ncbi:hypothetical protein [Bacillus inaquosorum]|uniref:hypothetical protein n=1 Tax=Bacillus inaquosorum TaxID=483913 RepID=UPI0022824EE4|nr:hypothetical protein [Bacillus inaquosorum]MCY8420268.1 hypothetical protein [Bacillus inaquosorum]MCY9175158.1 hypothetical protein [Bacillus inaquosorum]MEC0978981.1 hypothetical protein [Bacillus inaquosorum]
MARKGKCLSSDITPLDKGREYFLFPLGDSHYYVSKFDSVNAHCGAYEKKHFQVIDEGLGEEPPAGNYEYLDSSKIYSAELIWMKPAYALLKPLGTYYVRPKAPRMTHCYYFYDRELTKYGGIYPLHWFINFQEVDETTIGEIEKKKELPVDEWQQMSLF